MRNIPIKFAGYLAIGVFAFCAVVFLVSLVMCIFALKNNKYNGKKLTVLISLGCIGVVAVSWIFNIGWLRFVMTLLFVPLIHATIFFTVNIVAARVWEKSLPLKICNLLFCLTYVMANVFCPDVADIDASYFFFGIVKNPSANYVAQLITDCSIGLHGILFIVQLVLIKLEGKKMVEDVEEVIEELSEEVSEENVEE